MNISIHPDKLSCSAAAARFGAEKIASAVGRQGFARIIVATGASQFELLSRLAAEPGIDWSKVELFHLDEYAGLPETHPASFRKYIKERFIAKLPSPLAAVNFVGGDAPDLEAMKRELGRKLSAKPIDVAFIGIGENGHIAFNDPPADFDTEEPYLTVKLDTACRRQQLGEGWFKSLDEVPECAVSMSVRRILASSVIVNTVPDARKAEAVRNAVEGPLTPECPASALRLHPDCRTFCDVFSAAGLSKLALDLGTSRQ